jgi:hypothetical protein
MNFDMKQRNYIVCPQCKNDKSFECFGDRVDYGIYSIRIRCRKCDWVSDELYEETGYYPDLSKHAIQCHVQYLHEMQQESKEK